jgi:AraC-like DNA-binding protein
MQNYYLTDQTNSVDHLNRAFESIFAGSKFDTKQVNCNFESKSEGIITDDFFLGNQISSNIESINISDFNHFVITLPKQGQFSTHTDKSTVNNTSGIRGSILLPTERVKYDKATEFINDYLVAFNFQDMMLVLDRKFGLQKTEHPIFDLDYNNEKVKTLYAYIDSTLKVVRNYPSIWASLQSKLNIKEIALLMVSDLIGELLNKKPLANNNPEKYLVRKAEEIMDAECEYLSSVQEVADKVYTSPRNLQLTFKKHRNYTPMQFLKLRKLHKARKNILSNHLPNSTVKEIALGVGMFDLHRFSKYYSEIFGENPIQTIKKSHK